ncbi:MAG: hypothetical protein SFU91_14605 [Chloroherpetonaceae bacterium]|nr:hypothetical protein [Chloroherpetonaceae bacterium]
MPVPLFNRNQDPFDRMLIAQSINYKIPILLKDEQFDAYCITRIW